MKRFVFLLTALVALLCACFGAPAQTVRADHAEAELVAATDAVVPGKPLDVALRIKHDPEWHTYWRVPGDSGLPTRIKWTLPPGWRAGPLLWPTPKRLPTGPLINYGYDGEVLLLTELTPPAGIAPGADADLAARVDFLVCREVCIPSGADLELKLPVRAVAAPSRRAPQFVATRALLPRPIVLADASAVIAGERIGLRFKPDPDMRPDALEFFPLEENRIEAGAPQPLRVEGERVSLYLTAAKPVAADFTELRGVLVGNGGPAQAGGWAGEIVLPLQAGAVPVMPVAATTPTASAPQIAGEFALWLALAGALAGGVILNLMPCVFPVLSLKLLSLMQHQRGGHGGRNAAARRAKLRAHGLAFAAGVVLSFIALAGLLLALRAGGAQMGWGFQLQTPWVVAALTALFFAIGLNLLGVFEVGGAALANAVSAERTRPDRLSGSFATGVLAVVVAAPCTAPFMGAALGYAITQPATVALLVFAALGIGMALPYLVLSCAPALTRWLPRSGPWMLRFRQLMAFPMFAACVWLLWVLAQQINVDAFGAMLAALVLLGFALWAFGLAQFGARWGWRWAAAAAAVAAVCILVAATGSDMRIAAGANPESTSDWQPWSEAAVRTHLAGGKPVFVDFTAAWCVTCQVNERFVLKTGTVEAAFKAKGVARLRADWTHQDDAITRELARFGRTGVPLYVLYDRQGKTQVLAELLTERAVTDALAKL